MSDLLISLIPHLTDESHMIVSRMRAASMSDGDVAGDPQMHPLILTELARHGSSRVRAAVARNASTPKEVVLALRGDASVSVRRAAGDPGTPARKQPRIDVARAFSVVDVEEVVDHTGSQAAELRRLVTSTSNPMQLAAFLGRPDRYLVTDGVVIRHLIKHRELLDAGRLTDYLAGLHSSWVGQPHGRHRSEYLDVIARAVQESWAAGGSFDTLVPMVRSAVDASDLPAMVRGGYGRKLAAALHPEASASELAILLSDADRAVAWAASWHPNAPLPNVVAWACNVWPDCSPELPAFVAARRAGYAGLAPELASVTRVITGARLEPDDVDLLVGAHPALVVKVMGPLGLELTLDQWRCLCTSDASTERLVGLLDVLPRDLRSTAAVHLAVARAGDPSLSWQLVHQIIGHVDDVDLSDLPWTAVADTSHLRGAGWDRVRRCAAGHVDALLGTYPSAASLLQRGTEFGQVSIKEFFAVLAAVFTN